jgi:hypothetical protein
MGKKSKLYVNLGSTRISAEKFPELMRHQAAILATPEGSWKKPATLQLEEADYLAVVKQLPAAHRTYKKYVGMRWVDRPVRYIEVLHPNGYRVLVKGDDLVEADEVSIAEAVQHCSKEFKEMIDAKRRTSRPNPPPGVSWVSFEWDPHGRSFSWKTGDKPSPYERFDDHEVVS